tara:strand:+ start:111 stop:1286 length:1176 start_codon:yes stop_codon:yes gene_type:complete
MFTSSIFAQLLKLIPRDTVARLVDQHGSDRWRKSFRTWDHVVAMLAVQFSGAGSLRDLETILNSHKEHLYHLGSKRVSRSTLSEANQTRGHEVFRDLAVSMLPLARRDAGELKDVVSILDASPIRLAGRGHDWADETCTWAHNQGLKLHVQFAPAAEQVEFVEVSNGNVNDITVGREISLEAGRIYVFDKGYCDYNWWNDIAEAGSGFVTRLKTNAAFAVKKERKIANSQAGYILADQIIELTNAKPRAGKVNHLAGKPLRLIEIPHPGGKNKRFWIVSNDLTSSADQIADWYKQRWAIELLFKWLKQNLKIKRFIGESRNAILIQIYVAIIAYVLLKLFRKMSPGGDFDRLKDAVVYIANNLFYRPKTQKWRRRRRREIAQTQPELWPAT